VIGFPTTANAFSQNCAGAFFTKLTPSGDALLYSTCFGSGTTAWAIATDQMGNAYLTGSTGPDLPVTANAFQPAFTGCGGYANAFFSVFNPSLSDVSSLIYSTYLGASGVSCSQITWGDSGRAIAVDAYGMAYLTGYTSAPTFPVTSGAFQTTFPAAYCSTGCVLYGNLPSAFIAKFNPQAFGASSLIYSTYLGGSAGTSGNGIIVDTLGNAFVSGSTGNWFGGTVGLTPLPTTPGAYQTRFDGQDAFLTKLNAAGNNLVYSTLLGGTEVGSNAQWSNSVALDSLGQATVAGLTRAVDFPTTADAFETSDPSSVAPVAFVTKFDNTGSSLIYSSFLGGLETAYAFGVAVDQAGDAYVAGYTNSVDFPVTPFAFQPSFAGDNWDIFVTKFPIGTTEGISIVGITPNVGGNGGQVTPEIVGTGFHAGATVALNCGAIQVRGANVVVGVDGRILQAAL